MAKPKYLRLLVVLLLALSLSLFAIGCPATDEGTDDGESTQQEEDDSGSSSTGAPDLEVAAQLLDPPQVPDPLDRNEPALVTVDLETVEVTREVAAGTSAGIWTFNGTVPGPMVRARVGDTIEIRVKNADDSAFAHNIDLHAVNGPGGGAVHTNVAPGGEKAFSFKALNPGLYVYHCATPIIPEHVSRGMYGMILVEPKGGLPEVDKEFYVVQGDLYLDPPEEGSEFRKFSTDRMLAEDADYVFFNGSTTSLIGENAMKADVGDTVRIYFGVGGPNMVSSFHVIGEIFDKIYPEAGSETATNVQSTLVPAGGATMVEFTLDVPGTYLLVDHSLGRIMKGALGHLVVEGDEDSDIFTAVE